MTELPKISGWPDEIPYPDPKSKATVLLEDLTQLKENHKLASSPSWLSLFGKNAHDFSLEMNKLRDHPSSKKFKEIQNWFENAREGTETFSEILFDLHVSHYRKMLDLQIFLQDLLQKDLDGLNLLIHLFEKYVK